MSKHKRDFAKENDKIIGWFGGVAALLVFVMLLLSEPWRDRGCYLNENTYFEYEFSGRVVKKFIDYPNHAVETLLLTSGEEIPLLRGDFFSQIESKDSVHKASNSFELQIFKADTVMNMTYKLPCSEEGKWKH